MASTERAASFFLDLNLEESSVWWSKSNAFSLLVIFFWHIDAVEALGAVAVREALIAFGADLPPDYALAAREAVNNRPQRRFRHEALTAILGLDTAEHPLEGQPVLV